MSSFTFGQATGFFAFVAALFVVREIIEPSIPFAVLAIVILFVLRWIAYRYSSPK